MKNFGTMLRDFLFPPNPLHHLRLVEAKVARVRKEHRTAQANLEYRRKRLDQLQAALTLEIQRAQMAVDAADAVSRKLEFALTAAEEALRTANEIIIPGLVQANQTFKNAWDAESAMLTMRSVVSSGKGAE